MPTLLGTPLTRESIVRAIDRFESDYRGTDEYDGWRDKASYKYALVYRNRLYPPKRILSLASGARLSGFNGGSQSNDLLRSLGFEVIDKPGAR